MAALGAAVACGRLSAWTAPENDSNHTEWGTPWCTIWIYNTNLYSALKQALYLVWDTGARLEEGNCSPFCAVPFSNIYICLALQPAYLKAQAEPWKGKNIRCLTVMGAESVSGQKRAAASWPQSEPLGVCRGAMCEEMGLPTAQSRILLWHCWFTALTLLWLGSSASLISFEKTGVGTQAT